MHCEHENVQRLRDFDGAVSASGICLDCGADTWTYQTREGGKFSGLRTVEAAPLEF